MAYFPTHLFFTAESKQNGYQGHARAPSSRLQPGHVGYVYTSSDASKAKSPEQCHSSSARVHYSCWLKNGKTHYLFLLCAYANAPGPGQNIDDRTKWVRIHDHQIVPFLCLY